MPLYREVKPGDTLRIGDSVLVIERKSGQVSRLRIDTTLPVHHTKADATEAPAPSAPVAAAPEAPPRRPTLFRSPRSDD